jgi:hypothetical protein
LSLQRRMRPRTGKGPVQITMMETESENFIWYSHWKWNITIGHGVLRFNKSHRKYLKNF